VHVKISSRRILWFLLIGATLSLLVAWLSLLFPLSSARFVWINPRETPIWWLDSWSGPALWRESVFASRLEVLEPDPDGFISWKGCDTWPKQVLPQWCCVLDLLPRGSTKSLVLAEGQGWPLRCVIWYATEGTTAGGTKFSSAGLLWGSTLADRRAARHRRGLAYVVVPWALAIDSVVFALPTFLLLKLASRVRSKLRRRNNRCSGCGYCLSRVISLKCPECGTDN
jgi:hypothetical protein